MLPSLVSDRDGSGGYLVIIQDMRSNSGVILNRGNMRVIRVNRPRRSKNRAVVVVPDRIRSSQVEQVRPKIDILATTPKTAARSSLP